jgi:hypothetical protein
LHVRVRDALVASLLLSAACANTQSVPTPVSGMGLGTVAPASSMSTSMPTSSTAPWNDPAPASPTQSVTSLTGPMDSAMVLCTTALNLEPCGLITTGIPDMIGCFAACQVQIQTVANFSVESAAATCASLPPPEGDAPRECDLHFPPSAALDLDALGKTCGARCKELADALPRSFAR